MYKTLNLSWGTGHERYLAPITNTIYFFNNNEYTQSKNKLKRHITVPWLQYTVKLGEN